MQVNLDISLPITWNSKSFLFLISCLHGHFSPASLLPHETSDTCRDRGGGDVEESLAIASTWRRGGSHFSAWDKVVALKTGEDKPHVHSLSRPGAHTDASRLQSTQWQEAGKKQRQVSTLHLPPSTSPHQKPWPSSFSPLQSCSPQVRHHSPI